MIVMSAASLADLSAGAARRLAEPATFLGESSRPAPSRGTFHYVRHVRAHMGESPGIFCALKTHRQRPAMRLGVSGGQLRPSERSPLRSARSRRGASAIRRALAAR